MGILKHVVLIFSVLSILSPPFSISCIAAEQTRRADKNKVETLREFAEQKLRDEYQYEACESFKDCIFLAHEMGWSNRDMFDLLASIDTEPARKVGSLVMDSSKTTCVNSLVIYALPFLKVESITDLNELSRLLRFWVRSVPNVHQSTLDRLTNEAQSVKTSNQADIVVRIKGLSALAHCYIQHVPGLRRKRVELFNRCLQLCDSLQPADSALKATIISEILLSYNSNDLLDEREFALLKFAYEAARDLSFRGTRLPNGNLGVTFQLLTKNCDSKEATALVEEFRNTDSSSELEVAIDICSAWIKTRAGDIAGAGLCFQHALKISGENATYNKELQDYANVAKLAWELQTGQSPETVQEIEKLIAKLSSATTSASIYEPAAVGLLGRYYVSKNDWVRAKDTLERANKLFARYQHLIEDRGSDPFDHLIALLGGDSVPDQFAVPADLEIVYSKIGLPQHAVVHASEPFKQERKSRRMNGRLRSYYPNTLSGLNEGEASKVIDARIAYLDKILPPGADPTPEYIWLASLCVEQGFFTKAESCFDLAAKNEQKLDISKKGQLNCARLECRIAKGDSVKAQEILNAWTFPQESAVEDKTLDATKAGKTLEETKVVKTPDETKVEIFRQVKEFFKGRVQIASGDLQQGCATLSEAIPQWKPNSEYDGYYVLAAIDLGDAYATLGKMDEAKTAYQHVLALHRQSSYGNGRYSLPVELSLARLALLQATHNQGELADRTIFDALSNGEEPRSGLMAARLQESAGLVYSERSKNVRAGRLLQEALLNYELLLPANDARVVRCREEFAKVSALLKN